MSVAEAEFQPPISAEITAEDLPKLLDDKIAEFGGQGVREFEVSPETIRESAAALVFEFGINGDFFESPARCLMLLSAARELAISETGKDRALDITYLVSKGFCQKELDIEETKGLSDVEIVAIIERYVDEDVSVELENYVRQNGLVAEAQARFGVETPYKIRVIDAATDDSDYGYGVTMPENEDPEAFDEWSEKNDAIEAELEQLKANGSRLMEDMREDGELSTAWVTYVNGEPNLFLHKTTAHKIMRTEGKARSDYPEEDRLRDIALFQHEYVHTQNFGALNKETMAGITLEERRAELLSGDNHGYFGVKGFFNDIRAVTGFDIEKTLLDHVASADMAGVYVEIAKKFGIGTMLEIAMVQPKQYCGKSETHHGKVQSSLQAEMGGYSGIVDRIVKRFGDKATLAEYVEDMAGRIVEREMDPSFWASYFSDGAEPSVVKKRVVARAHELAQAA